MERYNIELIKKANQEMLNYFNSTFLENLEEIQKLKTQTFEIDIKIDELEKTKGIYAFKSTSRKSVFTPTISDDFENEKSKIIDEQIKDLRSVKDSLYTKIRSLEVSLNTIKKRLAMLNDAETSIDNLVKEISPELIQNSSDDEQGDFEFIEENKTDDISTHGYNILMHDAFEKAFFSTLIKKNIRDGVESINHKLEMLNYLLTTDISRAKLTLQEVVHNSKKVLDSVDDISNKFDSNMNSSQPIWSRLDDFISNQRLAHPECIINANIECTDYEINLHPVFTINLLKLLNIFFDNIFKHSNANNVNFKMSLSKNIVDVYLCDNGVGIDSDYLTKSPWYSSLHKAHEIIYLLGGTLSITGDILSGTTVKFNFSVQE